MNRSHGTINITLLASIILAAVAAAGWYYYFSELNKNQVLEKGSEAIWQELTGDLVQKQNTIDNLTQNNQELLASLASEKQSREQLRNSFEAIKVDKAQQEISRQQEINRVASTAAELEKELQQRQARQVLLEDKINRVSGEKSQLTTQLEEEQNRTQQLQQQIANVSGDVGQKEKALADAEQDVSQLNQLLETTRQEQDLLNVQIEELDQQRINESVRFARLKNRLEEELNESRVEIAQLKNRKTVIKLADDVLFDSGSARIKPAGQKVLSLIAESLNAYPARAISIEGHTDDVPTRKSSRYASNWELSAARALAAVDYFQQHSQVDPKRLKLVGYGEYRPAYSNATAKGRKSNRRIEIVVLPPESQQ